MLPRILRRALLALLVASPALARDGDVQGMAPLGRFLDGLPRRVIVAEPFAYVALDTGVQVFDVSNPATPVPLASVYLPSPAFDIALQGSFLLVAGGESGLIVLDVSNPSAPLRFGSLDVPGALGVTLYWNTAYLAESSTVSGGADGLRTVSVADPVHPRTIAFLPLPNGAIDVALSGTSALVGIGATLSNPVSGLVMVDVSDPAAPAVYPNGYLALGEPVNEVFVGGSIAYLASGFTSTGTFTTVDIANPGTPTVLDSLALCDRALGVDVRGTTAFLAVDSLGIYSVDVTDPRNPRLLDSLDSGRDAAGIATLGSITYLADRSAVEVGSLTAVNTADPRELAPLPFFPYSEATDVAIKPGLAFFLNRDALRIADTSGGQVVTLALWQPPQAELTAIDVDGNLAAIADGATVRLVDVTDPAQPLEVGRARLGDGVAVRPYLRGATLHVLTGLGLETFDVTSPATPTSLAVYPAAGWVSALAFAPPFGYLAAGDTLHVLDLSNPSAPTTVGARVFPGERLFGVAVSGGLAVVAGLNRRLYTLDITSPASPRLSGSLGSRPGFDVRLIGTRAVVAAGSDGVEVIDVSDPANPVLEASYDTSGAVYSLANDGKTLYLPSGPAQHWLVTCTSCNIACIESWPTVAANSLRAVKRPVDSVFSWQLASGGGSFNLHRTVTKALLPALAGDMSAVVGTTDQLSFTDPAWPGGSDPVFHYRVFGAGSCSGASHDP